MQTAMLIEKKPQADRILEVLKDAKGAWVSGQHFLRTMMLSQYHARIWELQNKRNRYSYDGVIEVSDFTDDFGFKSYRLVELNDGQLF